MWEVAHLKAPHRWQCRLVSGNTLYWDLFPSCSGKKSSVVLVTIIEAKISNYAMGVHTDTTLICWQSITYTLLRFIHVHIGNISVPYVRYRGFQHIIIQKYILWTVLCIYNFVVQLISQHAIVHTYTATSTYTRARACACSYGMHACMHVRGVDLI